MSAERRWSHLQELVNFGRAIETHPLSVRGPLELEGVKCIQQLLEAMEPGAERQRGVRLVLEEAALARQRARVRTNPQASIGRWVTLREGTR